MAEVYFEKAKQVANSLTIQFNGTSKGSFNGSSGVTINITPSAIGAAASSHSHSWSSITSKPSTFTPTSHSHAWADISGKPSTFTPSSHTHDDRYYTESEMNTKLNDKVTIGAPYFNSWAELVSYIGSCSGMTVAGRFKDNKGLVNGSAGTWYRFFGALQNAPGSQYGVSGVIWCADSEHMFYIRIDGGSSGNSSYSVNKYVVAFTSDLMWNSISGKPSTFTPASHSHSWGSITGKPSTFAPSSHTHDDRYYTESEMNTKLNTKLNTTGGTITGNLDVNGDLSASRGKNGYFRVGKYNAGLWSSSSQHLYIAASIGEHDYALVHGVTNNMWSFYPYKNNLQHVGSPTYRFRTIYLNATADVSSDRRLKHDIEPIDERYEKLFFSLIPRTYRLNDEKDDNKVHTGFIAQEVEDSILENGLSQKELAALSKTEVENEDGTKDYNYGLHYEEFISLNTHMIQKLYKIVDELKEEVALLKNSK